MILQNIIAVLGVLTSNGIYFSSIGAVIRISKTGKLNLYNPIPVSVQFLCSTCWLLLGVIMGDIYVVLANLFGVMVTMYSTLVTYGFAEMKTKLFVQKLTVLGFGVFLCVSSLIPFITRDIMVLETALSIIANLWVVASKLYYF